MRNNTKTPDGLAVVTEQTFIQFFWTYPFFSVVNDSVITERILRENPRIYILLDRVMQGSLTREEKRYYERGI